MIMNDQTLQFLYRAVILTVCLLTGGMFVFLFVVALALGDGEAVRIIDSMQPMFIGTLGAMVTTVLGSHAAGAYIAKQVSAVRIAGVAAGQPTGLSGSAQPTSAAAGSEAA